MVVFITEKPRRVQGLLLLFYFAIVLRLPLE